MNVQVFDQDDNAYFQWIRSNPRAFVINTTRGLDPGTMILHRATCHTIREYFGRAAPGGFTEREYIKICSIDIDRLRDWVRQNGHPDGSFSSECQFCGPLDTWEDNDDDWLE